MEQVQTQRNDNLKLIAMITMLIDHFGYMRLLPEAWYFASRTIGRIAFPIFAYQLAIGFEKTSNRKRYAARLFLFALISQIPYMWFNAELEHNWLHFNILFLLLAGLCVLQLFENGAKAWKQFKTNRQILACFLAFFWFGVSMLAVALPEIITIQLLKRGVDFSFEYSSYGLLMILIFHCFRKKAWKLASGYLLLSLVGVALTTLWVAVRYGIQITGMPVSYLDALTDRDLILSIATRNQVHRSLQGVWFQIRSFLGIPIILGLESYSGKMQTHMHRMIGYWFYPMHITLLMVLKSFIAG